MSKANVVLPEPELPTMPKALTGRDAQAQASIENGLALRVAKGHVVELDAASTVRKWATMRVIGDARLKVE